MKRKIELDTQGGIGTEVIFYFTREEPEDIESSKFKELFDKCDILFIELNNRAETDDCEKKLQEVSRGKIHPTEIPKFNNPVMYYPGFKEQVKYLYNSGKKVFLDKTPLSANECKKEYQLYKYCQKKEEIWGKGTKYLGRNLRLRDLELVKKLKDLYKKNPGKTILITRGAGHLFAWHMAKKAGLKPKLVFSRDYYEVNYCPLPFWKLMIRCEFGKEYSQEIEKLMEAIFVSPS